MRYLERNAKIIEEINRNIIQDKLKLNIGKLIGESRYAISGNLKTTFHSIGSYKSDILQQELFLGMKTYYKSESYYYEDSTLKGLASSVIVEREFPEYKHILPVFQGILINEHKGLTGIITEDFSEGKKYEVYPSNSIPADLENMRSYFYDDYEFKRSMFIVNGQLKFGDLDNSELELVEELREEGIDLQKNIQDCYVHAQSP
jgi:hypothetical protein